MGQELDQTKRLLQIMKALRDPQTGCPWDIEQTHASLRKYVIEEAYEVAETLDGEDEDAMIGELGDLLLQIVFHAEIGRGENRFDFEDIAKAISDKMVSRHPHVFGDAKARSIEEQTIQWEAQKQKERGSASALAGVSIALPALVRAEKLQKRAARLGFDWEDASQIWDKLDEEISEFKSASFEERAEEFGDILFTLVNLGRHYGLDAEEALKATNQKFTKRFGFIENALKREGRQIEDATLEDMETLWQHAKKNDLGTTR